LTLVPVLKKHIVWKIETVRSEHAQEGKGKRGCTPTKEGGRMVLTEGNEIEEGPAGPNKARASWGSDFPVQSLSSTDTLCMHVVVSLRMRIHAFTRMSVL